MAGLDIGSRSIEIVVLKDGEVKHRAMLPTTFDPLKQCREILQGVDTPGIVATGYGRKLFSGNNTGQHIQTITEIQAYAMGISRLFPQARTAPHRKDAG